MQASDRIVAKVFVRALSTMVAVTIGANKDGFKLLEQVMEMVTKDLPLDVLEAVASIVLETEAELEAEQNGTAVAVTAGPSTIQ